GSRRVLHYRVTGLHGRRVSFYQSHGSAPGSLPILRGAKGTGAVRFTPERGLASLHFVTAVVTQNGVAVETRAVAHYRTVTPARPAAVSGFRIVRGRRTLTTRWRA